MLLALLIALAAPPAAPPENGDDPCPCDLLDWRCRQEHGCRTEGTPPAPTIKPKPAPSSECAPEADPFRRRGLMLAGSVGIAGCTQPPCASIAAAGVGRLELGYRFGYVAPFVGVSGGGSPLDVDDSDVEGRLGFVDVGVGLQVLPVARGRVDPFVGLMLGYTRLWTKIDSSVADFRQWESRGAARLGGGLPIYVHERVTIGPRVDLILPFLGEVCTTLEGDGEMCTAVGDLIDEATTKPEERLVRRSFARVWSATVEVRAYF